MIETSADLTLRATTMADVDIIAELIAVIELEDSGTADYGAAEIQEDMSRLGSDLATDSWLGFSGGRLVCFGIIWERNRSGRIEIDHYVLREHVADGEYLLNQMLRRCGEIVAAEGLPEMTVSMGLTPQSVFAEDVLPRTGWRSARRYNVMQKPVSAEGDPVPAIPDGVVLRHPNRAGDLPIAHRLIEESFAEHYDHHKRTFDEWVEAGRDKFDEPVSWIASIRRPDGSLEDVGILLGRNNRDTQGWINSLGVVENARGRGIATLLLRLAFAGFVGLGRDAVGLGVDTENATGALGVYERVGMRRLYAVDTWKVTVQAAP